MHRSPAEPLLFSALAAYFGTTRLQAWSGGQWITVKANNYQQLITISYQAPYTFIEPFEAAFQAVLPKPNAAK